MKASFFSRHRGWVFAALLVPALTFNPVSPLVRLSAQTNAAPETPAAGATNAMPVTANTTPETNPAPATSVTAVSPATLASSTNAATALSTNAATTAPETDQDTGKPIFTTPSGLKYVDLAPGTGPAIKDGDEVTVKYEGRLGDGTIFDSSDKHTPDTFSFLQHETALIAGWTEGTSTMKVGGKRKLIIPPNLGYGADGNQAIPPNSTLIFTIEVLSAQPKPAK